MPLTPASSPFYEHTLKIKDASSPRAPGAVVLPEPSHLREDYQLKVAYRKYVTTRVIPHNAKRINFLFLHGNGMNKGIWHSQIDKLFATYELSFPELHIDTVIAPDHVNMGDSAYVNRGKLGHVTDWNDLAKDYIMLTKVHERESFLHPNAFNVVVAHSMGGFAAIHMTAFEPNLFQSSVLLSPVCETIPDNQETFYYTYRDWYQRGFVKFYFDNIPEDANWYHDIYEHYAKRSFYRKFDPVVLRNMLEDEIPEYYDRKRHYPTVELKHDGFEDYINYYSLQFSIPATKDMYQLVKVPTKMLCGDKDGLAALIMMHKDDDLKFADIEILEGKYHNMHAENPELIMNLVNDFVLKCYDNNQRTTDEDYRKKYGPDYKQKLRTEVLSTMFGEDKFPSKL
ncbi:Peroxisomal membrane protein LPX1 [Candida viswanathii]|uniref:Peroxisomal membrane protein LPX1 n=1 Tax=Candida viswanathii TaxID=5486 RepID=A0A367YMC4_9ASCO|nr:Peroxisomal membrane protein LPX1 [Candida viswanathii]